MEFIMAALIGVGLSAAVGFRIFTPLLITSIAEKASFIHLVDGFEWIGSTPALITFAVATILEIATHYIPVVDSIMKILSTPVAIIAGILLTASFIGDMHPLLSWSIAIIAGGGTASVSQFTTASVRGASTVTTGGLGNIVLSITEGISAVLMSIIAIFVPILAAIFVIALIATFIYILSWIKKRRNKKQPSFV